MDTEPLYSSEQIRVPDELPAVLREYAKEAIRAQPEDILAWSAAYFQKKLAERGHAGAAGGKAAAGK